MGDNNLLVGTGWPMKITKQMIELGALVFLAGLGWHSLQLQVAEDLREWG